MTEEVRDFCTPADIFAEIGVKEVHVGSCSESLKPAVVNLIKEVQKQDNLEPYGQKVIRRGSIPKKPDRLTVTKSICDFDYMTKKPKGGKK